MTAQQVSRQSKIHLQLLIWLAVSYIVHMCAYIFYNQINVAIIWVILCGPFATKMIKPVCYGVDCDHSEDAGVVCDSTTGQ